MLQRWNAAAAAAAPAGGSGAPPDGVPVRSWGGCPDGVFPVMCAEDPCVKKQCGAGSRCVSNLCGGCNADCVAVPAVTRPAAAAAALQPGVPLV